MLAVYRLLVVLVTPLALIYFRWKIAGPRELRAHWRERLGRIPDISQPVLWLHAASVGEVNAVSALIKALLERYPDHRLAVSTITLTGRAELLRRFGDSVSCVFAPLDTPFAVRRWLDRLQPRLAMVAETEIWPELYHGCHKRSIPIVLVNARLTPKAMRRYQRFRSLFRDALTAVRLAICQSQADAGRFGQLGLEPERIAVSGNLKFDLAVPGNLGESVRALRTQWGNRPAWVAGSTRPGEEEIVLAAHRRLLEQRTEALLVLAPRHPERSAAVARLITRAGLGWQAIGEPVTTASSVVLVDRIGVLNACYAAASTAFVGGSLVDIGGHNLLEPAALGKAVIAGPELH